MKHFLLMIVALVGFGISSAQAADEAKSNTPAPAQHLKQPVVPAKKLAEKKVEPIHSTKEAISNKAEEMDDSIDTPSEGWDSDSESYEFDE